MKSVFSTLRVGLAAGLAQGDVTPDEARLADLWLDLQETTRS
jgi:hypothetical protein